MAFSAEPTAACPPPTGKDDAMAMRRIKSSEAETKRAMEVAEKVAAALELRRRGTGARGEATQTAALDDDAPLPPPAAADDAK